MPSTYPSVVAALTLGAGEYSPMHMAAMYQTIAAGGFRMPLRSIRDIVDAQGQPLRRYPLDAAIIDIGLPGIDGLEVCRRLRANGRTAPVMMLTARHEVQDRVLGLDAGADDYLVKPFALDELLARVRALHRRHGTAASAVDTQLELDDLTIDPGTRVATRGEDPLDLTRIEFDLLHLLVAKSPAVLTRDAIHERIWGYEQEHMSNSLEVFVSQLRRKTERDGRPRLVHTVRGVGYTARRDPQAPTR